MTQVANEASFGVQTSRFFGLGTTQKTGEREAVLVSVLRHLNVRFHASAFGLPTRRHFAVKRWQFRLDRPIGRKR
jgi:hypothetical protein